MDDGDENNPVRDPLEPVHHVARRADWDVALADGHYRVSTIGLALDEVGFIHCARPEQVAPVVQRFYGGVDDLLLLTIDPRRTGAELRYEVGHDSTELFPHLYGPLPVEAVVAVMPYPGEPGVGGTKDDRDEG